MWLLIGNCINMRRIIVGNQDGHTLEDLEM